LGPSRSRPGDKFALSLSIKLRELAQYSDTTPRELRLITPPDIKCDATNLRGDQIKAADRLLTATVMCSGPKGKLRGAAPSCGSATTHRAAAPALAPRTAGWKFEIKS